MENLKWEVDQKEREIQSLKQQLDLTEHQSKQELDGIQQSLQVQVMSGPQQHSPSSFQYHAKQYATCTARVFYELSAHTRSFMFQKAAQVRQLRDTEQRDQSPWAELWNCPRNEISLSPVYESAIHQCVMSFSEKKSIYI